MRAPHSLDFFGTDTHIEALQSQLNDTRADPADLLELAWYLRERDPPRAEALARQAQALLDAGAAVRENDGAVLRARAGLVQAHVSIVTDELGTGEPRLAQAKRTFEALGDAAGITDTCLLAAFLADCRGDAGRRAHLRAAAVEAGARADLVRAHAAGLLQARDVAYAEPARAEALLTSAAAGSDDLAPGLRAYTAGVRAHCAVARGETRVAIAHFQDLHRLGLESGQVYAACMGACNAAACFINVNDFASALEWVELALAAARPRGMQRAVATALIYGAEALRELDRAVEARDLSREAVAILSRHGTGSRSWVNACNAAGMAALALGLADEALAMFTESEMAVRALQAGDLLTGTLRRKAYALLRLQRLNEAFAAANEALQVADSTRVMRASALRACADVARASGAPAPAGSAAPSGAIHYLEAALAEAGQNSLQAESGDWLAQLSLDYEHAGDLRRALDLERRSAQARAATHARHAEDLATNLHVRLQTERAKAEAAHHKALADVQAQRAEAAAKRADAEAAASRAKTVFLANMSHELRSPLNAMLGFSRLLMRNPSLDDVARRDMAVVLSSGERLYWLINQVLELSKIEAARVTLRPVASDLISLLDELEKMFTLAARDKGLHLLIGTGATVPRHIEVDAPRLHQVLVILLSNAIKFTTQGGVHLHAEAVGEGRISFTVTDTGIGIAADELGQLGQPFVQAQAGRQAAEGTGLGLAIGRSIVRLLGGNLVLHSVPGRGTRASFDVAVRVLEGAEASAPAPLQPPAAHVRLPAGPAPRILVADDQAEGRQLLVRLLSGPGFEVREAGNGQEVLEVWQQWRPRLICMDMRMPVMDGREAARRIKATPQGRATVIIAVTASSFEEEREEILAVGCDDFLRKPFQEEALFRMLARHLNLRFAPEAKDRTPGTLPDKARLAALPRELRMRLCEALARLEVRAVERALQDLRVHDARAAAMLAPLIESLEYDEVDALLRDAP